MFSNALTILRIALIGIIADISFSFKKSTVSTYKALDEQEKKIKALPNDTNGEKDTLLGEISKYRKQLATNGTNLQVISNIAIGDVRSLYLQVLASNHLLNSQRRTSEGTTPIK